MLADERTLLPLPEPLTYEDGALVACGFGTAWQGDPARGRVRARPGAGHGPGPGGPRDADAGARRPVRTCIGVDINADRRAFAEELGAVRDLRAG